VGYDFPTLPDLLRRDLALVLVGINPGARSVARGHYFSSPSSRFWPAFSRSRLSAPIRRALGTDRLSPDVDARLLDFGIGFTDVVKRTTANASELTGRDFALWAPRLVERLRRYRPRVVAFHGLTAYRAFVAVAPGSWPVRPALGPQAERLGASRLFVIPNPSGANAHFRLEDLVAWYDTLAEFLASSGDR